MLDYFPMSTLRAQFAPRQAMAQAPEMAVKNAPWRGD